MKRLRAWFLAPSWTVMLVLFLAPLVIVCAYSFETRGVYGGISPPWTGESYQRLADPIYLAILWRSFWVAGLSTGTRAFSAIATMISAINARPSETRRPTPEETGALLFAWRVCKHVKSNAIVYARFSEGHGQTVGVGAGQMSRVDAARFGAMKAVLPLLGTVAAWMMPGLLAVVLVKLYSARRGDPARRTPPTLHVAGADAPATEPSGQGGRPRAGGPREAAFCPGSGNRQRLPAASLSQRDAAGIAAPRAATSGAIPGSGGFDRPSRLAL